MPLAIEKADLYREETWTCYPFLHHGVRFVADLPFYCNRSLLPFIKGKTTR
jgi:hypothetical protein